MSGINFADATTQAARQRARDEAGVAQLAAQAAAAEEAAATEAARRSGIRVDIPQHNDFFNVSEISQTFRNPGFDPSRVGGRTGRFNFETPGSGAAGTEFPAKTFDSLFKLRFLDPIDLSGLGEGPTGQPLGDFLGRNTGGLGGALQGQFLSEANLDPSVLRALELNEKLRSFSDSTQGRLNDEVWQQALAGAGINPSQLNSIAGIDAIPPEKKLAAIDLEARLREQKNQRPKQGIGSSPVFSAVLGLAGLFNPLVAATLGGAVRGAESGSVLSGLKGAAEGFGLGSFTHGFTRPGVPPGVDPRGDFGGQGTVRPTPRDIGGEIPVDTTPGGRQIPVFGNPGDGVFGFPRGGGTDRRDPQPPDVNVPGGVITQIPGGTQEQDDPTLPPIIIPDTTTTTTGQSSSGSPSITGGSSGASGAAIRKLAPNRGPVFGPSLIAPHIRPVKRRNRGDTAIAEISKIYPAIGEAFGV